MAFAALTHVLATCVSELRASFRPVPACSAGFARGSDGSALAPVHSHSENNCGVSSRPLPVSLPVGFYPPHPPSHPTVQSKPASHTYLQHLTEAGGSSLRCLEQKCPRAGRGEGNSAVPVCTQAPKPSVSATPKALLAETPCCASPQGWPRVPSWAWGQAVHLTHPIASHLARRISSLATEAGSSQAAMVHPSVPGQDRTLSRVQYPPPAHLAKGTECVVCGKMGE